VFLTRPAAEWERNLAEFDVACVEVDERPCELVLMTDEMWRAAGLVVDVVHPTLDEHPRLGPLVQFSRSETVSGAAPLLGQDTDAVLAELGYSQSRIEDLRSRGVIL
jgi:crotonobetainyl-CoA:carnitine CoA-transferase CaiB-like acyl-CoA transferase